MNEFGRLHIVGVRLADGARLWDEGDWSRHFVTIASMAAEGEGRNGLGLLTGGAS